MKAENILWKIGGEAGHGIKSSGFMFAKTFTKKGYHVVDSNEYPSLVQGGHNTYIVRVSTKKIHSISKNINILVALDKKTIDLHKEELSYGGYILYDEEDYNFEKIKKSRKDINYISIPFNQIIKKINAPDIMRNIVALGASLALVDYDIDVLGTVIKENFSRKGEEIVNLNIRASELGFKYIKEKLKDSVPYYLETLKQKDKMFLTGNDAVFLGGVRAGCKFYVAYPMTPSSSILHSFAKIENDFNIVVKHAESELAVINMAIGASFAGARSMLATSGGGFSLMNEGLGAAAMTETPVVVVLCQRPGPATGLPTWSEQGDMLFAIHSSHGEFLRVVLAPGDPEECFYMTGEAFNIADKYQIPVIIMLDKYLSENHFSYDKFDPDKIRVDRGKVIKDSKNIKDGYKRYEFTEDGISNRTTIGIQDGIHIANTDEHDEYGYSEEDSNNRKKMMDKRFNKVKSLIKEIPHPKLYGPKEADITIWSWGSTKGPILEAMKTLNEERKKINLVHFTYLYPFLIDPVIKMNKKSNKNVIIENNKTSQLSKLIMMNTGIKINSKILKYSGRQFLPEEIVTGIEQL